MIIPEFKNCPTSLAIPKNTTNTVSPEVGAVENTSDVPPPDKLYPTSGSCTTPATDTIIDDELPIT